MDQIVDYADSDEDEHSEKTKENIMEADPTFMEQAEEFERGFEDEYVEQKQITPGRLVEPRPPRRPSDVYDEEETPEGFREKIEDNEDIAVDAVMEFGSGNTPNVDETTPMSSTGSVDDDNLPMTYATTLPNELPPSPPGVCDSALEKKFEEFFEKKSGGQDIIKSIKRRKDFKNPAIYEYLVEKYQIDEKGSNFDIAIYDPNFSASDYYDSLGEYQAVKVQESHKKGPSGNPQIVGKTSLKTSGSAGQLSENVQHRRSRFEVSK